MEWPLRNSERHKCARARAAVSPAQTGAFPLVCRVPGESRPSGSTEPPPRRKADPAPGRHEGRCRMAPAVPRDTRLGGTRVLIQRGREAGDKFLSPSGPRIPQIHTLKPNWPWGWRWGLRGSSGGPGFLKEAQESPLPFLHGGQGRLWHPDLGLPAPRPVRNKSHCL